MRTSFLLLAVAFALLANVGVQMMSHRYLVPQRLVASLAAGFAAGVAILSLAVPVALSSATSSSSDSPLWHWLAVLIIYGAGSFTFLCLVAAGETSVRFQIVRLLSASPNGLTPAELDARYRDTSILDARLARLVGSGAVVLEAERYHVRSVPLVIVARLFRGCRMVIYGRGSEFDSA
jgi:hypothetical protein